MTITSIAQANTQGVAAAASGIEAVIYLNGADSSLVDPTMQAKGRTLANKALLYFARAQGFADDYFGYVVPPPDGDPCS